MEHTQDLKESHPANGRSGKNLAFGANGEDNSGGNNNNEINDANGFPDESQSSQESDVLGPAAWGPKSNDVLQTEECH